MKQTILARGKFGRLGKKALLLYIGWCLVKGILILVIGSRFF